MEKFKIEIEYKNGKKIKLENVEQVSKYDISDYVAIKLCIPTKEIKNYYVNFSK